MKGLARSSLMMIETRPSERPSAVAIEVTCLSHAPPATAAPTAVISHRLWKARFGGTADIVGTPLWEPIGPHLHIDPGNNRTLVEYVKLSGVRRAVDTPELTVSSLEVPYGEDVRDPGRRDQLLKGWLIKTLLDGGYTGVEARVEALQPPQLR